MIYNRGIWNPDISNINSPRACCDLHLPSQICTTSTDYSHSTMKSLATLSLLALLASASPTTKQQSPDLSADVSQQYQNLTLIEPDEHLHKRQDGGVSNFATKETQRVEGLRPIGLMSCVSPGHHLPGHQLGGRHLWICETVVERVYPTRFAVVADHLVHWSRSVQCHCCLLVSSLLTDIFMCLMARD